MRTLLWASEAIHWINGQFGKLANLLVLVACFVSAGNAMSRYAFSRSSNGFLEIQWYMFAVMVMAGLHFTEKRACQGRNISPLSLRTWPTLARFDRRHIVLAAGLRIDGVAVMAVLYSVVPGRRVVVQCRRLLRWPIKFAIPAGFTLVALQGISEVIKRIAALQGWVVIDAKY